MRALVLLCLLEAAFASHHHQPKHVRQFSWNGPGEADPAPGPNTGNACGTDDASCGCCVIQREIAGLETYINTTLNKLEREYLQTNRSLTHLLGSRTAFSLGLWDDERKCLSQNRYDRVIIYKKVFLNLGNNYNVETGVFTVSRSGVYMLAVTVASDAGASKAKLAMCANLQVNGKVISSTQDVNTNDQEDSSTIVVALPLTSGDRVEVILPKDCYICDDSSHYNTFTGYMIYSNE